MAFSIKLDTIYQNLYWKRYITLFQSHLIYACQIWGQSFNTLTKIQPLEDKALRVINFKANNHGVRDLYKSDQTLKMSNYIKMLNCLSVGDVPAKSRTPSFQNYGNTSENLHHPNTRHAEQSSVVLTQWITAFYGIKSIPALAWNKLQKVTNCNLLQDVWPAKEFITNKIINGY